MENNRKNVPIIRFPEFTDPWEQRKLSECASFRRGSFPQPYGKAEWYDGEDAMPFVQVADVADDMRLVPNTKQKISKLAQPMSVFAERGSVLVTLQGSIGRVAITQYEAFVDRTVLIFEQYNPGIDRIFWAYIIKEKFIDEARKAPGGTIKTITKEALSDFDLMIPQIEEQRKLGVLLTSLDNVITLHQRKCDELKKEKKSMLQHMFPQTGEAFPRVRFPGFTDPWEPRKLGDLVDRVTRKNTNNESTLPLTISAQYGLIDQMEFFGKRIASRDISGYYLLYQGEFAYNKSTSGDAPWGAVKRLDRYESGAVSTLYITFAIRDFEKTDSDFLACYYDTDLWYKGVQAVAAEGARNHGLLNISPTDFFNTTLMVPTNIEEQTAIGSILNKVDDLITLHQRKCDELEVYKKGLLQKMFV